MIIIWIAVKEKSMLIQRTRKSWIRSDENVRHQPSPANSGQGSKAVSPKPGGDCDCGGVFIGLAAVVTRPSAQ